MILVASLPLLWWNLYVAPKANALRELRRLNAEFDGLIPNPSGIERWSGIDIDLNGITSVRIKNSTDSLAPLRFFPNVEELHAYGPITDLSPLKDLSKLEGIFLDSTLIEDLGPLRSHKQLEHLEMPNSRVKDVGPLGDLKALERVELSYCRVNDISAFAQSKIRILCLSGAPISDLTPLENSESLCYLDVSGTNVRDISALSECKSLSKLNLDDTQVSDLTPLESLVPTPVFEIEYVTQEQAIGKTVVGRAGSDDSFDADDADPFATNPNEVAIQTNRISGYENGLTGLSIRNTLVTSLEPLANQIRLTSLNVDGSRLASLEGIERLCVKLELSDDAINPFGASESYVVSDLDLSRTDITSLASLKSANGLKSLKIEGCSIRDLNGIENNKSLEKLVLAKLQLDDISALSNLPITEIRISNCEIADLTPLRSLKHLERLHLEGLDIDDCCFVEGMRSLRILRLKSCTIDTLPKALSLAKNLGVLDISNTNIADLSPLADHGSLYSLLASDCPVSDLRPLSRIQNLQILEIGNSKVSDFESLGNLKQLQHLSLRGNDIDSIEMLSGLKNLRTLSLEKTNVTDLSPLRGCEELSWLLLKGTPIKNLDQLRMFPLLSRLDISGTAVKELTVLSRHSNLGWLDISDTTVTSLAPLVDCPLHSLCACDVPIPNVKPLERCKSLRVLAIANTHVSDEVVQQSAKKIPDCNVILERPTDFNSVSRRFAGGVF